MIPPTKRRGTERCRGVLFLKRGNGKEALTWECLECSVFAHEMLRISCGDTEPLACSPSGFGLVAIV